MKQLVYIAPVILLCACSTNKPPISHAHLGHALTGWHDTPSQNGLLDVAESEGDNAWRELDKALSAETDACDTEYHLENVIHSLNPEHQPTGNGDGYGAIAALRKTRQHVLFAADTNDASENVKHTAEQFSQYSDAAIESMLLALAQARYAASFPPSRIAEHLPPLKKQLELALFGSDLDNDGTIGNLPEESGLKQLRAMLEDMIANEIDPEWQPVPNTYLFGVIRLPNGQWGYKSSHNSAY